MRTLLALALVLLLAAPRPAVAQEEHRVALVIGNGGYAHVPRLANPGNDATLVANTLKTLGFTLVGGAVQQDVDKAAFDKLVQAFGHAIQGADVALFYYAGHGMQVDGSNWLVPTDANPTRPQDLAFQMVNADLVLQQMDGAGTRLNLVILDACRNNPFTELGTRAVQPGLAQMRAPEGTMISFATQPGNAAMDGKGANGPYALALVEAMRQPSLDIFRVFNRVGLTVKRDTNGAQLPWVSSSPIDGEFFFATSEAAPEALAAVDTAPSEPRAASPAAPATPATPDALRGLAEQGNAGAQTDYGFALAKGTGVTRDDVAARHWFTLAAAQGSAKAQYWMGALLERGRGGPRSYAEAMRYYRQAADQGFPPAEAALGRFYGRGLGVPRDSQQRTAWYRRAADHNLPLAQYALGNFYQFGDGVEKDEAQARQWFERAAGQDFVPAELRLGLIHEHGNGVKQDDAEAARWFRLAADKGSAHGLNDLGVLTRRGAGVKQDYAEAMRLFRLAADKGSVPAAFNIGLLYANGHGVARDRTQAREWMQKAAASGDKAAAEWLAHDAAP